LKGGKEETAKFSAERREGKSGKAGEEAKRSPERRSTPLSGERDTTKKKKLYKVLQRPGGEMELGGLGGSLKEKILPYSLVLGDSALPQPRPRTSPPRVSPSMERAGQF